MTKEEIIRIFEKMQDTFLKDTEFRNAIDSAIEILSQPSLPSNINEAAELDFMRRMETHIFGMDFHKPDMISAFKAGAEWMAGQGVKIGETKIYLEDDGDEPPYAQEWLDLESTEFKIPDGAFKDGDKVEVILRKK